MSRESITAGALTEAEILSEPRCWAEALRSLERDREVGEILALSSSSNGRLFIGCGSSYYVALAAAASWTALTGQGARALPASELLLFPELYLRDKAPLEVFLISRSGTTSEILKAADYLKSNQILTFAISCAPGQELEKLVRATVCLPAADEKSTVMTRSFTSMLVGLQFIAAKLAGHDRFLESLGGLPAQAQPALDLMVRRIPEFVQSHDFADYVFLGQGPFYGLASEGALKVKEMSRSYAQSYHTLEFRHGPKSIVGPETLIAFFLSEQGYDSEREVLEEVKSLAGTTLVIANRACERVRKAADLLLELSLKIDEYARLAASILPGQLLGLYTGLKKRQDPDRPRNLSRAVILNG